MVYDKILVQLRFLESGAGEVNAALKSEHIDKESLIQNLILYRTLQNVITPGVK